MSDQIKYATLFRQGLELSSAGISLILLFLTIGFPAPWFYITGWLGILFSLIAYALATYRKHKNEKLCL